MFVGRRAQRFARLLGAAAVVWMAAAPRALLLRTAASAPTDWQLSGELRLPLVDLDGDGRLDAVSVARPDGGIVHVSLSGRPHKRETLRLPRVAGVPVAEAVITDYDRDGDPDIAVLTANGTLVLWQNVGDGTLVPCAARAVPVRPVGPEFTVDLASFLADSSVATAGCSYVIPTQSGRKIGTLPGLRARPPTRSSGPFQVFAESPEFPRPPPAPAAA